MNKENINKHSFKIQVGVALSVLLFVVTTTIVFTKKVGEIEASIKHLNGKTDLYTERYAQTILDTQELKVDIAKIQTQLTGMQVTQSLILKEVTNR